jgi:hypothetical protein
MRSREESSLKTDALRYVADALSEDIAATSEAKILAEERDDSAARPPLALAALTDEGKARSLAALTDEGKARSLAAMHDGWQRWLVDMRARKAAGEIDRFPGGRKSGAGWVTPRMRELPEIEAMRRVQDARIARQPPPPPRRRRGRPTIIARAQAQILRTLAQLPEHSPLLAGLHGRLRERVAEAERRNRVISNAKIDYVRRPEVIPQRRRIHVAEIRQFFQVFVAVSGGSTRHGCNMQSLLPSPLGVCYA